MCVVCGSPYPEGPKPGRRDNCPGCGRPLKTCLNCRFYAPGASKDCAEPQAELVREKDAANFCDWFELKKEPGRAQAKGADAAAKARDAFKGLFG
jgi:hypothetical protein